MSLASFRFQFGDARSSVNLFHLEDVLHQFSFWVYYPISALSSIQTLILDVEPNFCFWNAIYKVYLRLLPFQYLPVLNKKTGSPPSRKAVGLLVLSRELESLALWLKEPTGQNTLILEVSSLRHFCAKHRGFSLCNFRTLCRILQLRVPFASLETVQKQCRNRALTLEQIKNDDFWSMTWRRFEWPQR